MSIESLAVVLHHSKASGTDKVVLIGIANHDGDGGSWPTVATLAKYANVSERSVQRSLSTLERMGEIRVYTNAGGTPMYRHDRRPNVYEVLVRCPRDCDGTKNHRNGVTDLSRGDVYDANGVTSMTERGDASVTQTVLEPSIEPYSSPDGDGFDEFWSLYPRKVGKPAAEKAYKAAIKKVDPSVILASVERYRASRRGENPKFTKHPGPWLNGGYWDEYEQEQVTEIDFNDIFENGASA